MKVRMILAVLAGAANSLLVAEVPRRAVEPQPLAENARRIVEALDSLGRPVSPEQRRAIDDALQARDVILVQDALDPLAMFVVSINPEGRVKAARGDAPAQLQQGGSVPVLIKIINEGDVTAPLGIDSPQAGSPYAGVSEFSLQRQQQTTLNDKENTQGRTDRFLRLDMFGERPLTGRLSGLEVEYAIALIDSSEAGKRAAVIQFDAGQGTEDLGFRAEVPVLFDVRPAVRVKLSIFDHDGTPTVGKLELTDARGHVYPPQARRIAPDFFFQKQIYRNHQDAVLLPPGRFTLKASRGPEYRILERRITIPEREEVELAIKLQRWIETEAWGFYSGDHHIHAAGCAHYQFPTQGVSPYDMYLQVKGEGLNVGCVLTWGPCFEFQRQFFSPEAYALGDKKTKLKYDLEISGFGSAALGHVCLLNLRDQTYPGSEGTKTEGWPSWTLPVLSWAKRQGAVTGYAHSASGLQIIPELATDWIFRTHDANGDGMLSMEEARNAVLPGSFATLDRDGNNSLSREEVFSATDDSAEQLPNLGMPAMAGAGALELPITVSAGVCDFISSMDTARIQEWNMWYHVLNCGFPLKVSGETDFPCMSSTRVGQGRVYVQLGEIDELDFPRWCEHLAQGKSYVSDGFAHAVQFEVQGISPGFGEVQLRKPETVTARAKVAFAPETPETVAQGLVLPKAGRRTLGDTVQWNQAPTETYLAGGTRRVELIVNGTPVASQDVPADGEIHDLAFDVAVDRSSWIALRQFPQLHTNPVDVIVNDKPIRVSRDSARWCAEIIELLWYNRERNIRPEERAAARAAYDRARADYLRIARECAD